MKKLIYILPIALTLLFFAGCKRNGIQTWNQEWYINCTAEEKWAEACNMVYLPVCWDDWETYWNSCVACSSQKINTYKMWECNCNTENWICSIGNGENIEDNWNDNLQDENLWEGENSEDLTIEIPETIIEVPVTNF